MNPFNEIISHQGHLQVLRLAVDQGTMPHAMLFWGHEGTGALAAALAISQYMVCRDRNESGSCGVCKGCVKSDKFMHPDIHFAFPTIGTKVTGDQLYPQWRAAISENPYLGRNQWLERIDAEGKQGNINVEDCQRIINVLMLHRFEADCKILILWLPEYLGREGNRLLKLIEEPPEDTYIFLVAENRDDILPTILSRCQQYYFPLLHEEVIRDGLIHQLKIEAEQAAWIASAAQGDWNAAIRLAAGKAYNPVEWVQEWVKAGWNKDPGEMTAWVDVAAKYSREETKQFLRYILGLLEKVLWLKFGKDFQCSDAEKNLLGFLNKKIEHQELMELVALCEENLRSMQQNVSGKILWFHLTIQLQKLLHGENVRIESAAI